MSVKAGSVAHAARGLSPVSRHSTDSDILVSSFVQIASRMSATGGDSSFASVSALRSLVMRSLIAVVAFADQQAVAVRRDVVRPRRARPPRWRRTPRRRRSAPSRSSCAGVRRDRGRKGRAVPGAAAAGRCCTTRECRSARTRSRCPGRAAERRRRRGPEAPVAFSVLITTSCGPSCAGSPEALTFARHSRRRRRAVFSPLRAHRLEMRPAHHARNLMAGARRPAPQYGCRRRPRRKCKCAW